ncbi:hypothetical protein ACI6QG_08125 [Roseococcus sp. DSY-14]|uniref:hypothetical protein n=1 Tax=Roseococcus sp. DSY-14 TaxID=3369650 RepID=UPI00387B8EE6
MSISLDHAILAAHAALAEAARRPARDLAGWCAAALPVTGFAFLVLAARESGAWTATALLVGPATVLAGLHASLMPRMGPARRMAADAVSRLMAAGTAGLAAGLAALGGSVALAVGAALAVLLMAALYLEALPAE